MTLQDLLDWFGQHQYWVLGYFLGLLVLTILITLILNKKNINSLKYVMSAIVYGVAVPGILATILVLYSLFILRTSLLQVSVIAYFVPILAAILTLFILNKKVHMNQIPGFKRLSALLLMILISFAIVFVLQKMYFGVFFIGGFGQLILVFAVVLIVLKFAWARFTK